MLQTELPPKPYLLGPLLGLLKLLLGLLGILLEVTLGLLRLLGLLLRGNTEQYYDYYELIEELNTTAQISGQAR